MVFCLIFNLAGIFHWIGLLCAFCRSVIIYINIYCYPPPRAICREWALSFTSVVFRWPLCVSKDNARTLDNSSSSPVRIWKSYLRCRLKCCVFRREVMIFFFLTWYILLVTANFLECFKSRLKPKRYSMESKCKKKKKEDIYIYKNKQCDTKFLRDGCLKLEP